MVLKRDGLKEVSEESENQETQQGKGDSVPYQRRAVSSTLQAQGGEGLFLHAGAKEIGTDQSEDR